MIEPARLSRNEHPPRSIEFDDVYFDHTGTTGIDRMFFAPAAIERRARESKRFTIGELGFGSGANFLHACAVTRNPLHFISVEKHPLSKTDLIDALAPFESSIKAQLINDYPPPVAGWHRRHFDDNRVQLSVWIGDVEDGLEDIRRQHEVGVDAWFLDGFAPTKNPAMWSASVIEAIGECSAAGASVTTFTAAGNVRRRLTNAGFRVERIDQTPIKRHSTLGWYSRAGRTFQAPRRVRVRGAGLAGVTTARALHQKGIDIELVDDASARPHASAVPAAVVHGRLMRGESAESAFRLHAGLYSIARLKPMTGFSATPVIQLPSDNQPLETLADLAGQNPALRWIEADEVAELAGIDPFAFPGLLFTDAGIADLLRLTRTVIGDLHVSSHSSAKDIVEVWATGFHLPSTSSAEVTRIGGQLDRFRTPLVPRIPIVGRGSMIPAAADEIWVGATYEYQPWAADRATTANRERYTALFPNIEPTPMASFRAERAVSSDRIPVVGRHGIRWLNLAHGSHGTTTAPFCAECVASRIAGELAPGTSDLLTLIDPARFDERQRRRPNPFTRPRSG